MPEEQTLWNRLIPCLRFYEAKAPMNRGCLPEDVACAVMYCVEQKYETGQAIPVTGGQVMLN